MKCSRFESRLTMVRGSVSVVARGLGTGSVFTLGVCACKTTRRFTLNRFVMLKENIPEKKRWCYKCCGCCYGCPGCCRFMLVLFIIYGLIIAFGVWGSWRVALMILIPFLIWMVLVCGFNKSRRGIQTIICVTFTTSLVYLTFTMVYISFASQAAYEDWPLQIGNVICNQSSCSSVTGQDINPYRPKSFGPLTQQLQPGVTTSKYFHFCPNIHCRWAGSNGNNTIQGYEEDRVTPCSGMDCPNYASTNVKDYPNKGIGLSQGFFLSSVVTETALCEGVSPVVPDGQLPQGRLVCATCTFAFARHNLIPNTDGCTDSGGDLFCWVCPGYIKGESTDFASLQNISVYFLILTVWFFFLFWYLLSPIKRLRECQRSAPKRTQSSNGARNGWPILF